MKRYKVTCYPTVESFEVRVEADSIQSAIEQAEETAQQNCCFTARESDVESED